MKFKLFFRDKKGKPIEGKSTDTIVAEVSAYFTEQWSGEIRTPKELIEFLGYDLREKLSQKIIDSLAYEMDEEFKTKLAKELLSKKEIKDKLDIHYQNKLKEWLDK